MPIAISQLRLQPVQLLLSEAAPRDDGGGLRLDERAVRALRLLGVEALLHDATERPLAVPSGRTRVEMSYRPPGLAGGAALSSVALLLLVILSVRGRRLSAGR